MTNRLTLMFKLIVYSMIFLLHFSVGQELVHLLVGRHVQLAVPPLEELLLQVGGVPGDTGFLLMQVHSQHLPLTLSLSSSFPQGQTVSGSSVGILSTPPQLTQTFYLQSSANATVPFLALAQNYSRNDPLPGGCNQVFALEDDPNIYLREGDAVTEVIFQWSDTNGGEGDCEQSSSTAELTYDLYVAFAPSVSLEEASFFRTVGGMLTAEDIMANGKKVASFVYGKDKSASQVSVVRGTGTVYAVVVTQTTAGQVTRASYVPVSTYSCSFLSNDTSERSCQFLANNYDTLTFVVAVVFGLCGLAVCLFGHYLFKFGVFVAGMWFACLAVAAGTSHLTFDYPVFQLVVLPTGLVFGLLWVAQWHVLQRALLAVLPAVLLMGVLLSAVLFYTPLGNVSYFNTVLTFSLTSVVVVVFVLAFSIFNTRAMNIISLALTGSFMVMLTLDISVRGSFKYLFFNFFRRVAVPGFLGAVTLAPLQTKAIGLMGGWLALFALGLVVQFYMARQRPPFPYRHLAGYDLLGRRAGPSAYGSVDVRSDGEGAPAAARPAPSSRRQPSQVPDYSERTPLLPDYGGDPRDSLAWGPRVSTTGSAGAARSEAPSAARSGEMEAVAASRSGGRGHQA